MLTLPPAGPLQFTTSDVAKDPEMVRVRSPLCAAAEAGLRLVIAGEAGIGEGVGVTVGVSVAAGPGAGGAAGGGGATGGAAGGAAG
jgi:hypothetical protein